MTDDWFDKRAGPRGWHPFRPQPSLECRLSMEEMMDDELMVPFDKRNAAMLNEMGFSITDEPGYGEIASVEGEMAVHVLQLANGRLRLSIDLPDGSVINADIVGRHRADCPSLDAGLTEAMTMTDDNDDLELLRQGRIEEYLARADMTDEQLMRQGEAAWEEYEARCAEMRAAILPMAYGLMAALNQYRTAAEFEAWHKSSAYADFSDADIAAHCQVAEEFLRTTTLVEPQEIWNAIKDRAEPPKR